jgi:prevent-host-death family protein
VRSLAEDEPERLDGQDAQAWLLPDLLRARRQRATIVAMSTESLREVRDHFSEVVDRVEHEHDRVTVTRNGRPAAVILSPDDLAQLEETLEILSDPEALADIREADIAYRTDDVVRGIDAVRSLRT